MTKDKLKQASDLYIEIERLRQTIKVLESNAQIIEMDLEAVKARKAINSKALDSARERMNIASNKFRRL